jgi:hypothetical protein
LGPVPQDAAELELSFFFLGPICSRAAMEGHTALPISWKRTLGIAGIIFSVALKVSFILERADLWAWCKLYLVSTVLGGDPAARAHRVEQFTALRGL